jgi:DNA topoisomerase-1
MAKKTDRRTGGQTDRKAKPAKSAKATGATKASVTVKAVREAKAAKTTRTSRSAKRAKAGASARGNGTPVRPGDALVIVESPTKARTIGKYLGRGYAVKATVGHLRDLPTRKLGVEIDEKGRSFQPEYVTIKGKTQTLSDIKKAAKAASQVLLATDPRRRSDCLARGHPVGSWRAHPAHSLSRDHQGRHPGSAPFAQRH